MKVKVMIYNNILFLVDFFVDTLRYQCVTLGYQSKESENEHEHT